MSALNGWVKVLDHMRRRRRRSAGRERRVDRPQVIERGAAIENLDVLGLRWRETTHRPCQLNEMRLEGRGKRMHSDLARQVIGLARIAGTARRNDVGPYIQPPTRQWDQMIALERFASLECGLLAAAELARVAIAREEERVRHLAAELARHVDEAREANDRRVRNREAFGSNQLVRIRRHDLRLPVQQESERTTYRNHRQRFERSVESKTAGAHNLPVAVSDNPRCCTGRGCASSPRANSWSGRNSTLHASEPAIPVGHLACRDAHVNFLNRERYRARFASPDLLLVHRPDRRQLSSGTAEERLVRDVQHLARNTLLRHVVAQILRDSDHAVACDPVENGRRDGRRVQRSVAHDEQILTTALGHESEGVQHYPFDVAVAPRFHLRELRVEIIAAGLRQRRHRVRRRTTPARYAYVHAILERLVTEIPPPDPRDYERLYRRLEWQHSHLLAGSQCD